MVVPAGSFVMGSPDGAGDRHRAPTTSGHNRSTLRRVQVRLTFDEIGHLRCYGNCNHISDDGFRRGQQPLVNVTSDDAQPDVYRCPRWPGSLIGCSTQANTNTGARGTDSLSLGW